MSYTLLKKVRLEIAVNDEYVDKAVSAAKDAFESFSQTTVQERLALLGKIVEVYQSRYDEIAETISSDELLKETADEGAVIENLAEALEKAISEEEYEVAARLRDRIKQLEKKSTPQ